MIQKWKKNQLKREREGRMPRGPQAAGKNVRKEMKIHHLHPPQRSHFSDASLIHPSFQGVPKDSSKQRTKDGLNVNTYPWGVEPFVTKEHSWGGKGLSNQSSRKALKARKNRQWKRDGKPREESEVRVVGLKEQYVPAAEMRAQRTPGDNVRWGLGQGTLMRLILARNQRVSLGLGLSSFSRI